MHSSFCSEIYEHDLFKCGRLLCVTNFILKEITDVLMMVSKERCILHFVQRFMNMICSNVVVHGHDCTEEFCPFQ